MLHWLLISLCAVMLTISAVLIVLNNPYLGWNYSDPETAVVGVAFHAFEWLFVRLAPIILIGVIGGVFLILGVRIRVSYIVSYLFTSNQQEEK